MLGDILPYHTTDQLSKLWRRKMTKCFPQQVVEHGLPLLPVKMYRQNPVRWIRWILTITFVLSVIQPLNPISVLAQSSHQSVPWACRDDHGNPVRPLDGAGAWAIILNFNHPKSTTETLGCWAIRDDVDPTQITYQAGIRCQLINNVGNVEVGLGKAEFDGNFQIVCPRRVFNQRPNHAYSMFYVHAKAHFPQEEGSYTLIEHNDVEVAAQFSEDRESGQWHAKLTSRYGAITFEDTEQVDMIPEHRFGLQSTVIDGIGSHHINRDIIETQRKVAPFTFDFSHRIHIGGQGEKWTLYNLVLDPPPPGTGFN